MSESGQSHLFRDVAAEPGLPRLRTYCGVTANNVQGLGPAPIPQSRAWRLEHPKTGLPDLRTFDADLG